MTKMRSAYSCFHADPVVRTAELPLLAVAGHRQAHDRRLLATELDGVADQVLKQRHQQCALAAHARQLVRQYGCARLLQRARQRRLGLGEHGVEVHELELVAAAPDAREGEQVVDQGLHPFGAVHGELDVLVGALVELAAVAALQCLAEACDLAQRLLQVVRGDIGELLELGVGALQVERLGLQLLADAFHDRELAHDALSHRIDLGAEPHDLAGTGGDADGLLEIPGAHQFRFASQLCQRAGNDPSQQIARSDQAAQDERRGDQQHDLQEVRVVFELLARKRESTGQSCLQPVEWDTQRIEKRLALDVGGHRF